MTAQDDQREARILVWRAGNNVLAGAAAEPSYPIERVDLDRVAERGVLVRQPARRLAFLLGPGRPNADVLGQYANRAHSAVAHAGWSLRQRMRRHAQPDGAEGHDETDRA